jgi:hypothetical protein
VLWSQVSLWRPDKYNLDEFIRYCTFFMAQTEAMMRKTSASTSIILFDVSGWKLWHVKYLSYVKELVNIVQNQVSAI